MATMIDRPIENGPTFEDDGFEMILDISSETRNLLSRMAADANVSEFEAVGRAIALYQIALAARREGKRIGIFGEDCELEREIVGL